MSDYQKAVTIIIWALAVLGMLSFIRWYWGKRS